MGRPPSPAYEISQETLGGSTIPKQNDESLSKIVERSEVQRENNCCNWERKSAPMERSSVSVETTESKGRTVEEPRISRTNLKSSDAKKRPPDRKSVV